MILKIKSLKKLNVALLGAGVATMGLLAGVGPASAQTAPPAGEGASALLASFKADAEAAMTEMSALMKIIFIGAMSGATGIMAVSMYKRITGI